LVRQDDRPAVNPGREPRLPPRSPVPPSQPRSSSVRPTLGPALRNPASPDHEEQWVQCSIQGLLLLERARGPTTFADSRPHLAPRLHLPCSPRLAPPLPDGAGVYGEAQGSTQAPIRLSLRRSREFPPCPRTCTCRGGLNHASTWLSILAAAQTFRCSSHDGRRVGLPLQCRFDTRIFRHMKRGALQCPALQQEERKRRRARFEIAPGAATLL
jgi:hypothetical protein